MRSINTKTMMVEAFYGDQIPPYAILSHTSETDEVLFQDMSADLSAAKEKSGFTKIHGVCRQAVIDGLDYVHVGTACIDVASPVELSKALNSEFSWFQRSTICYVYLSDVPSVDSEQIFLDEGPFYKARWFTRGWTLPELIAPQVIHFFNSNWNFIGTKRSLSQNLSSITGIPTACLTGSTVLDDYSIAERMSWASKRSSTRVEDKAYCLMGLFDINMPIVNGEGKQAFLRLQDEIMKRTTDQSFLAWAAWRPDASELDSQVVSTYPVLAQDPAYFPTRQVAKITKDFRSGNINHQRIIRSDIGISIWMPVLETLSDRLVFAVLNCETDSDMWIPLWKTERQSYHRVGFPSMTLFHTGSIGVPHPKPSKLCLEEPLFLSGSSTDLHSFDTSLYVIPLNRDISARDPKKAVEVLVVHLDGKESALHLYPPTPSNEDNHFGTLRLHHVGGGYYHGIVIFELNSTTGKKTLAIFFAASMLQDTLRAWTCRVLLELDKATSAALEKVSSCEFAKICCDEKIPLNSQYFESSIWRHGDQNGRTVVELFNINRVIIAKTLFEAPTRDHDLSQSITAAFRESRETEDVARRTTRLSLG